MNKRVVIVAVAAVAVLAATLGIRVCVEGRGELAAGREALQAGKPARAQTHFLHAARWYLPFVSTSQSALEELLALGESYEADQDHQRAVSAFDDARGAIYSVRWLTTPHVDLLAKANQGYARTLAAWKKTYKADSDIDAETARYLSLANEAEQINPWWMLFMGLAFVGYVFALAYMGWRWENLSLGRRIAWGGCAVVCLVLWLISMSLI